MTTSTAHPHIVRNDEILGGEPIVKGTRTSVRAIVQNWRMGLAPEEIPLHLPHLTLAQVFDALSYYAENRDQIHEYMAANRVPYALVDPAVRPETNNE